MKVAVLAERRENGWKKIDRELEKLSEELSDTLLLVTADHGHIDGRNVSMEIIRN